MLELWVSYWRMLHGAPLDSALAVGIGFVAVLTVIVMFVVLFRGVDTAFRREVQTVGIVVGRDHTPGYHQTTWIYDAATKVQMPLVAYVPPSWTLAVEFEDVEGSVDVVEDVYASAAHGMTVIVFYRLGRLTRSKHLDRIVIDTAKGRA